MSEDPYLAAGPLSEFDSSDMSWCEVENSNELLEPSTPDEDLARMLLEIAPDSAATLLALIDPEQTRNLRGKIVKLTVANVVPTVDPETLVKYNEDAAKTVLDLQLYKDLEFIEIDDGAGRQGEATLVNLHSGVNRWFLLQVKWADGGGVFYHLENPAGSGQLVELTPEHAGGVRLVDGGGFTDCSLWTADTPALEQAKENGAAYVDLCDGRLYVRNQIRGRQTSLEKVTDGLRTSFWGGEKIISLVKKTVYRDAYLETSDVRQALDEDPTVKSGGPAAAKLAERCQGTCRMFTTIGLQLAGGHDPRKMAVGQWYPSANVPGVFVSAIQPRLVSPEVTENQRGRVNALDAKEGKALSYLVAFDLEQMELGYQVGTSHPDVGWSERVPTYVVNPVLPGPDGIDSVAPLARTGMVNPTDAERTVATFTAGFKRYHGAFRSSEYARENHGTHYGFVSNGVVFSKLQIGLATLVVYEDGEVVLKTWTDADNQQLWRVRHARQNGLPIIAYDDKVGRPVVNKVVRHQLAGNWSGDGDANFRTVRGGLCMQENEGRRYLIYGFFSAATPSAMARVFEAYGCSYAMLLDMNSFEHTYLALYRADQASFMVEQLVKGMEVLDEKKTGEVLPRFIGYGDNRDFFYVMRREG
ncbi:MAG: hypothetical protein P9L99_10600 [Candidatus Lernaella stagnicola]|nr:hypothetical protein [Candidatus Lernaella stagnicola]